MTELELIREAQAGSVKATNKLCKMHAGFIHSCALKYSIKDLDQDDIVQICYLGLLNAIRDYREEMGFKLISFAAYKIRGKMHKEYFSKITKLKRSADVCSLDATYDNGFSESIEFGDSIGVEHEFYSEDCFRLCEETINESHITEKKKEIMRAILFNCEHDLGIQFREIAKRFNISHQRVYQIMESITDLPQFKKLKRELIEITTE